jgi:predicted nucleic acid-binding protein
MNRAFADAFYFVARLNPDDFAHEKAREFTTRLRRHLITTEWVLAEVADALCHPRHRQTVVRLLDTLANDPTVTIIPATHDLFREGLFLYSRRRDKDWPLTDCISFVVMEDEGIHEALTGDKHFEQAGFVVLLK